MPTAIVDRRLFFDKPDPAPNVGKPIAEKHQPLSVGASALISIPGHEGIGNDLENLIEHNERVRWLTGMLKKLRGEPAIAPGTKKMVPKAYVEARKECVARSLITGRDSAGTLQGIPETERQKKLLGKL